MDSFTWEIMPPSSPATAQQRLLDAHESRIQRLEELARETASQLATYAERFEALSGQLETGFAGVAEKIVECTDPMIARLAETAQAVEAGEARLQTLEVAQRTEDTLRKRVADRSDTMRKGVWAVVGAGVGALLKEAITHILKGQ